MGLSASRSAVTASDNAKVDETHITSNGIHLFDVTVENSGPAGTGDSATSVTTLSLIVIAAVILIVLFCLWHQVETCLGCCQPCWKVCNKVTEENECRSCRHARQYGLGEEERQERGQELRESRIRSSTPVENFVPSLRYEMETSMIKAPKYWTSTMENL